jgi:sulfur carrier protein ThiS adenylyltransferase
MTATRAEIFSRNVPGSTEILRGSTVAVAGCGGLGSNAAVALVRAGVGGLILVDHDTVEASNLNRQCFFQGDIGRSKPDALAAHLRAINPEVRLDLVKLKLTPGDVPRLFSGADLLIEAFDRAESKRWLVEAWCRAFPGRKVICASGVSGLGKTEAIAVRRSGDIILCGDETSDLSQGLCSARVGIVANMQANLAIEVLVTEKSHGDDQQP